MSEAPEPMPPEPLRELLRDSLPRGGAQSSGEVEARRFYIPGRHVDAVRLDRPIVLGMRGAGKSTWWAALQSPAIRGALSTLDARLGIEESTVVTSGFGAVPAPESYPSHDTLRHLLDSGSEPRAIWRAVIAKHTFSSSGAALAFSSAPTWAARVRWVEEHPDEFDMALSVYQRERAARNAPHLIVFDALDRTAFDPRAGQKLLRGLLQVALELLSYRGLRTKVFARHDMFDAALDFPDASKLLAVKVELKWESRDLFALLFQYLGNGAEPEAQVFRERVAKIARRDWVHAANMWLMPRALTESDDLQRSVFHAITGSWMGHNHRRGLPWSWLPRHLADALKRVNPRYFLVALQSAAEEPPRPGWPYALHFEEIKAGVREASKVRVREVQEDIPWVAAAIGPMSGLALPAHEADILRRLRDTELLGVLRDLLDDPTVTSHTVLQRLIALGMVERMTDGRINMPDVYRVGFGLRLKGESSRSR